MVIQEFKNCQKFLRKNIKEELPLLVNKTYKAANRTIWQWHKNR